MPIENSGLDFLSKSGGMDSGKFLSYLENLKSNPKEYKRLEESFRQRLGGTPKGKATPDPFIAPISEKFKIGDRVVLKGLKTTKYNGQVGTIAANFVEKKGRWPVKLEDGTKAFKAINLRLASKEDEEPVDQGTVLQPVMCIKTRIAEDSIFKPNRTPNTKVFVNYLQMDDDLYPFYKNNPEKRATAATFIVVSNFTMPVHITPMWDAKDAKGRPALRVDCVMNSMVYERKKTWPQMNHWIVEISFEQIETQEGIKLSRNFNVLQKEKYYGERKYSFKPSKTVIPGLGGILPEERLKESQKQSSPEIKLPFEKMGEGELKARRTTKLGQKKRENKKKKKSSVRLVIEEMEETSPKANKKREFLDLTRLDEEEEVLPKKQQPVRDKRQKSKKPLIQEMPVGDKFQKSKNPLIQEMSAGDKRQKSKKPLIQEIPDKPQSKPLIEELPLTGVSKPGAKSSSKSPLISEVKKNPLKQEMSSTQKGKLDRAKKLKKKNSAAVAQSRKDDQSQKEKPRTFKVRGRVKERSTKATPPYRIVRGSKGVKVIVILDNARCALEVNATWERFTRELQVETTSSFLSLDLSSELKSKIWDSKDPVTTFSTESRALKVAFLQN